MKSFLIPANFSPKNQEHVQILQQSLIALDYKPETPFVDREYGEQIKELVRAFKAENALPETNNMTAETIRLMNSQLEELYSVIGEVKDDYGMPVEGAEVMVYETIYEGEKTLIGKGQSLADGSYRVYLSMPDTSLNKNGVLKSKKSITVEIKQDDIVKVSEGNMFVQGKENIYNFSSPSLKFRGKSVYRSLKEALTPHNLVNVMARNDDMNAVPENPTPGGGNGITEDSGNTCVYDMFMPMYQVEESSTVLTTNLLEKSIIELRDISKTTGLNMETLMKLFFAEVLEAKTKSTLSPNWKDLIFSDIEAETFFAFIYQRLPMNMSKNLYNQTMLQFNSQEWIDYQNKVASQINIGLALMSEEALTNALTTACKTYIIDPQENGWISNNVQSITSQRDAVVNNSPLLEGDVELSDIINEAGTTLNATKKTEIANLFVEYINDFNGFINALDEESNRTKYTSGNIDKLILIFQLSRIVRNYSYLINIVKITYPTQLNTDGARFVATLSKNEWKSLSNHTYPSGFENVEEYAQFIYNNVQKLYPDIITIVQLAEAQTPGNEKFHCTEEIINVLLYNKDRNMLTDNINSFEINDTLEDESNFMEEFATIQQVYRISPSPQVAVKMLNKGITNTAQIYFMGKEELEAYLGDVLTLNEIKDVYAMASARFANALIAYTNLNKAFNSNNPYALPQYEIQDYIDNLQNEITSIKDLFGDQDHCECDHDSSVYSAAAYLADLLLFLDEQKNEDKTLSILDYLKTMDPTKEIEEHQVRRSDICKIGLTAKNTNTMLPYIDLVCEVLEEAVITSVVGKGNFTRDDKTCQSNLSTEELCAAPEHILQTSESVTVDNKQIAQGTTAYDVLKRSMYPMYAPINLEQMESRACLAKMGIARHELMETFGNEEDNTTNGNISAEYFGLTNLEQNVITESSETEGEYSLSERNEAWSSLEVVNLTGAEAVRTPATTFMQDTGLTAYEVLDLIAASWINLTNINITEDCSFTDEHITAADATAFDRAHRFIRLWRKSDWKMWELNLLLFNGNVTAYDTATTNDNLNAVTLNNLRLFSQQQKALGLSCDSLLAFYGKINAIDVYENGKRKPSLYDKIFLNTVIQNPVNTKLKAIKDELLDPERTTIDETIALDGSDDELVAACLSISKKDYDLLKSKYTETLNIEYLSYLYRHATFAKKLKISIPELLTIWELLWELMGRNIERFPAVYQLPSVGNINEIMATVQAIKDSKISVFEYEYLIQYGYGVDSMVLSEGAKALALTEEQLKEYVTKLNKEVREKEELLAAVEQDEDATEEEKENRRNEIVATTNTLIQNHIAQFFNLSTAVVETLVTHEIVTNQTLLKFIGDINNYEASLPSINIYKILILLHKASLLIKKTNITPNEFELLLKIQDKLNFNWFRFKTDTTTFSLPFSLPGNLPLSLQNYLNLDGIRKWHKLYGIIDNKDLTGRQALEETLLDLLASVEINKGIGLLSNAFIFNLCKITGWDIENFTTLIEFGGNGFDFRYSDFYESSSYAKIQRCMEMLDRMQVPATTIMSGTSTYSGWRMREADEDREKNQNAAIKGALKAKYDINTWLQELTTIQQPIRETKADALSSYLIAVSIRESDKPIEDKADLYGIFLLDPEMSPLMKTSRIVQATCSVQLLMQRIFLNLENIKDINVKEHKWKQWEWMKRYRMWEAGLKVFLYPENFIEPELRDDKSPFFKEMEDELNQNDITLEHAETVFVNYLEKLHEVSNLTIVGIYNEEFLLPEEERHAILHVIGRSRSIPYQYYYRNFNQTDKTWSHWEKIELDIKGETVVPVIYNRKLHLFWLNTIQKTHNNSNKDDAKDPYNYTEIQLEWSMLKNKKWSPVKCSKKKHIQYGHLPVTDYSLLAWYDERCNEIVFSIYNLFSLNKDQHCSYNILSGIFYFNGSVYRNVSNIKYFGVDKDETIGMESKDTENAMLFQSLVPNLIREMEGFEKENQMYDDFLSYCAFNEKIPSFANDIALRMYLSGKYFEPIYNSYCTNYENRRGKLCPRYAVCLPTAFMREICSVLIKRLQWSIIYNAYNTAYNLQGQIADDYNKIELYKEITGNMDGDTIPEYVNLSEHSVFRSPNAIWHSSRFYPMNRSENGDFKNGWDVYLPKLDSVKAEFLTTANQGPNILLSGHNKENMSDLLYKSHTDTSFFYQDAKRSFLIQPPLLNNNSYLFSPFYHPYTNLFINELNHKGIPGFLNRDIQFVGEPDNTYISSDFANEYNLIQDHFKSSFENGTIDLVDFSETGAYSSYNWELFFHVPLYIACKLSQNQKHEEAMKWFHYIFNPTYKKDETTPENDKSSSQKFWITKPFFNASDPDSWQNQMKEVLTDIKGKVGVVNQWLNDPFNPHLIARTRSNVFQKTVVMKYISNIIDWADKLFRQDTMESNNEATLLYILAYEILGKRPLTMPAEGLDSNTIKSYEQVAEKGNIFAFLNDFDIHIAYEYTDNQNIKITLANRALLSFILEQCHNSNIELSAAIASANIDDTRGLPATATMVQQQAVEAPHITNSTAQLAPHMNPKDFCVPYNDQLLRYWDIVADRLFKLRNCMNIDGIVRELPLFAPPIDPAMLVRAAAAGLSMTDILNEVNAKQPYYRFRTILQKAIEFTGEVKQLGEKLLAALEKKDAETLNLLRGSQEINMQQAMKQVRKLQIDEAKQHVVALEKSIKNADARKDYYAGKELMNKLETDAYRLNMAAAVMNDIIAVGHITASILSAIPTFQAGGAGIAASPFAVVAFGGENLWRGMNATMASLTQVSQLLDKHASLLLTKSGYERRKEDWDFQAKVAAMESEQLNEQLLAAEIRLQIAEKELQSMELQIEQSQVVNEFYKDKFTNEQLYNWMITEVSKVYLDAYKLAYDMAKKAERCYKAELGIYQDTTPYIQFGYWDSLKKGLLAGDRLMHDLHRLDAAYIDKNKRTLELTKHISLAEMFPEELIKLITTKETTLDLEEYLFDMDYPGHYMRRIKSVAVTIPNVAGPHTTVSFMLTLQNNPKVRVENVCFNGEYTAEENFILQTVEKELICTSSAQNDSGMFELNFGDERYLPFENFGVISKWGLSFPAGCNQFDLSTVSDVILHINYTALYDGGLALKAKEALKEELPQAGRMLLSLKHGFPTEWEQLNESNNEMNFDIKTEHLPFFLRGQAEDIEVSDIALMLVSKNAGLETKTLNLRQGTETLNFSLNVEKDQTENPAVPCPCGDVYLYYATIIKLATSIPVMHEWKVTLGTDITSDDVEDIIIGFNLNVNE